MKFTRTRSLKSLSLSQNLTDVNSKQINDQFRKLSQLTDFGEFANEVEIKWKKCEANFVDDLNYQCIYCENTFDHPLFVRQHILVVHLHLEPERYECLRCGKVVTELEDHLQFHRKSFECKICGEWSWNQSLNKSHIKQHESVKPVHCDICNVYCVTIKGLQIHKECHEKHKDDDGNYTRLTPRIKRYQEFCLTSSPTKKSTESSCGFDTADSCVHFDADYKLRNVYLNSKYCDTRDLEDYTDQFAEPCSKKRKIVDEL